MYDFDNLWNEFSKKLLNYIKVKVKNSHDAEDILQSVFIKIYNSFEQLENKSAIRPWIYRITNNTIIDFYKKKKDVSVDPEVLYMIKDEFDSIDHMNDEIAKCIENMLFDLPEKYQYVYDMHENKEMKHKEIAKALNISVSTSKVRLKRAKDMFKERLMKCCDFKVDKYGNILDYNLKGKCVNCDREC